MSPKHFLPLLGILCLQGFSAEAIDSTRLEPDVTSATVFFSGAEIERKGKVYLKSGRNVLIFRDLSPSLEENSIQLKGSEGLRIRSVEKTTPERGVEEELKQRIQKKKDSLEDIGFKLSLRKGMKKVYSEERNMILENKKIKGEQTGTDIEDLMELAVYYRKRLKDIEYKLIEVNRDIEELQKTKQTLQDRIRDLERKGRERVSRIIVVAEAESSGSKELSLSYFSPRAGWRPAYELNCPSLGEAVQLTYKGEVWQRTGKDWKDIQLTLASGRPTKSGDQPEMEPWRLSFRKTFQQRSYRKKGSRSMKQRSQQQSQGKRKGLVSMEETDAVGDNEEGARSQGAIHARFPIENRSDIPSARSSRSVTIKKLSIDAEHDHLAVPKKEQEAFLIAKLSGWEATDLFPGQASVQYAGRYVGKTHIDPDITKDTLEVSLGRDQGVVVERRKVRDKTSSQILGGKKVLEVSVEIELKNKRSKALSLRVKDQIPISGRGDVEVELDERSGAEYDKETGRLDWRIGLEAGKKRTLEFGYTVKYPKELDPIGL